jgi:hypothetical protein
VIGMRLRTAVLAAVAAAIPLSTALAADQPRRLSNYERAPAPSINDERRAVVVDRMAGRAGAVVDEDGVLLKKSFVDPAPPARVERRVYVRENYRRAFQLYGGFYGLDRWGYSRGGW